LRLRAIPSIRGISGGGKFDGFRHDAGRVADFDHRPVHATVLVSFIAQGQDGEGNAIAALIFSKASNAPIGRLMLPSGASGCRMLRKQKTASAPCGVSEKPALQAGKTLPNRWSERQSQKTTLLVMNMKPTGKYRLNSFI